MNEMLRDRRRSYVESALSIDTTTRTTTLPRPQSSPNVKRQTMSLSRRVIDLDEDDTEGQKKNTRRRRRQKLRTSTSDPTVMGESRTERTSGENFQTFLHNLATNPSSSLTRHESWSEEQSESRRQRRPSFDDIELGRRRKQDDDKQQVGTSLARHTSWSQQQRRDRLGDWRGVAAEEMMVPDARRRRSVTREVGSDPVLQTRRPSLSDGRKGSTARAVNSSDLVLEERRGARRPSFSGDGRRRSTAQAVTSDPLSQARRPSLSDGRRRSTAQAVTSDPLLQARRPSLPGDGRRRSTAQAVTSDPLLQARRPSLSDGRQQSTARAVNSDLELLQTRRPSLPGAAQGGDNSRKTLTKAEEFKARMKKKKEAAARAKAEAQLATRRPSLSDGRRRSTARAVNSDPV